MATKIYIEFEDVYKKTKARTELMAINHENEQWIMSDSYKETLLSIFSDAVDDLRNRYFGSVDTVNYDGTVIYTLTKELEDGDFKRAQGLLTKALSEYMLWDWFHTVGAVELSGQAWNRYNQFGKDIKRTASSKFFFPTKSRPYF